MIFPRQYNTRLWFDPIGFSRRWCVQEIALAASATVYCGAKQIDWHDFADAVIIYEQRSEDILRSMTAHENHNTAATHITLEVQALGAHSLVSTVQELFRRRADHGISAYLTSMETLMSILPAFDVSNSKDVIYAVRSLAKDFQRPDVNKKQSEVMTYSRIRL